jgi:hypothetical protein
MCIRVYHYVLIDLSSFYQHYIHFYVVIPVGEVVLV